MFKKGIFTARESNCTTRVAIPKFRFFREPHSSTVRDCSGGAAAFVGGMVVRDEASSGVVVAMDVFMCTVDF